MIRKSIFLVLAALISAPIVGFAEHPEHPKAKSEHPEHPTKKKSRAKKKASKFIGHKKTMREFVRAVEDHIDGQVDEKGWFEVYDKVLKKTWRVELDEIHKHRIARLSEDEFFACADFHTISKKRRTKLDLDFFVTQVEDGFIVDEYARFESLEVPQQSLSVVVQKCSHCKLTSVR